MSERYRVTLVLDAPNSIVQDDLWELFIDKKIEGCRIVATEDVEDASDFELEDEDEDDELESFDDPKIKDRY